MTKKLSKSVISFILVINMLFGTLPMDVVSAAGEMPDGENQTTQAGAPLADVPEVEGNNPVASDAETLAIFNASYEKVVADSTVTVYDADTDERAVPEDYVFTGGELEADIANFVASDASLYFVIKSGGVQRPDWYIGASSGMYQGRSIIRVYEDPLCEEEYIPASELANTLYFSFKADEDVIGPLVINKNGVAYVSEYVTGTTFTLTSDNNLPKNKPLYFQYWGVFDTISNSSELTALANESFADFSSEFENYYVTFKEADGSTILRDVPIIDGKVYVQGFSDTVARVIVRDDDYVQYVGVTIGDYPASGIEYTVASANDVPIINGKVEVTFTDNTKQEYNTYDGKIYGAELEDVKVARVFSSSGTLVSNAMISANVANGAGSSTLKTLNLGGQVGIGGVLPTSGTVTIYNEANAAIASLPFSGTNVSGGIALDAEPSYAIVRSLSGIQYLDAIVTYKLAGETYGLPVKGMVSVYNYSSNPAGVALAGGKIKVGGSLKDGQVDEEFIATDAKGKALIVSADYKKMTGEVTTNTTKGIRIYDSSENLLAFGQATINGQIFQSGGEATLMNLPSVDSDLTLTIKRPYTSDYRYSEEISNGRIALPPDKMPRAGDILIVEDEAGLQYPGVVLVGKNGAFVSMIETDVTTRVLDEGGLVEELPAGSISDSEPKGILSVVRDNVEVATNVLVDNGYAYFSTRDSVPTEGDEVHVNNKAFTSVPISGWKVTSDKGEVFESGQLFVLDGYAAESGGQNIVVKPKFSDANERVIPLVNGKAILTDGEMYTGEGGIIILDAAKAQVEGTFDIYELPDSGAGVDLVTIGEVNAENIAGSIEITLGLAAKELTNGSLSILKRPQEGAYTYADKLKVYGDRVYVDYIPTSEAFMYQKTADVARNSIEEVVESVAVDVNDFTVPRTTQLTTPFATETIVHVDGVALGTFGVKTLTADDITEVSIKDEYAVIPAPLTIEDSSVIPVPDEAGLPEEGARVFASDAEGKNLPGIEIVISSVSYYTSNVPYTQVDVLEKVEVEAHDVLGWKGLVANQIIGGRVSFNPGEDDAVDYYITEDDGKYIVEIPNDFEPSITDWMWILDKSGKVIERAYITWGPEDIEYVSATHVKAMSDDATTPLANGEIAYTSEAGDEIVISLNANGEADVLGCNLPSYDDPTEDDDDVLVTISGPGEAIASGVYIAGCYYGAKEQQVKVHVGAGESNFSGAYVYFVDATGETDYQDSYLVDANGDITLTRADATDYSEAVEAGTYTSMLIKDGLYIVDEPIRILGRQYVTSKLVTVQDTTTYLDADDEITLMPITQEDEVSGMIVNATVGVVKAMVAPFAEVSEGGQTYRVFDDVAFDRAIIKKESVVMPNEVIKVGSLTGDIKTYRSADLVTIKNGDAPLKGADLYINAKKIGTTNSSGEVIVPGSKLPQSSSEVVTVKQGASAVLGLSVTINRIVFTTYDVAEGNLVRVYDNRDGSTPADGGTLVINSVEYPISSQGVTSVPSAVAKALTEKSIIFVYTSGKEILPLATIIVEQDGDKTTTIRTAEIPSEITDEYKLIINGNTFVYKDGMCVVPGYAIPLDPDVDEVTITDLAGVIQVGAKVMLGNREWTSSAPEDLSELVEFKLGNGGRIDVEADDETIYELNVFAASNNAKGNVNRMMLPISFNTQTVEVTAIDAKGETMLTDSHPYYQISEAGFDASVVNARGRVLLTTTLPDDYAKFDEPIFTVKFKAKAGDAMPFDQIVLPKTGSLSADVAAQIGLVGRDELSTVNYKAQLNKFVINLADYMVKIVPLSAGEQASELKFDIQVKNASGDLVNASSAQLNVSARGIDDGNVSAIDADGEFTYTPGAGDGVVDEDAVPVILEATYDDGIAQPVSSTVSVNVVSLNVPIFDDLKPGYDSEELNDVEVVYGGILGSAFAEAGVKYNVKTSGGTPIFSSTGKRMSLSSLPTETGLRLSVESAYTNPDGLTVAAFGSGFNDETWVKPYTFNVVTNGVIEGYVKLGSKEENSIPAFGYYPAGRNFHGGILVQLVKYNATSGAIDLTGAKETYTDSNGKYRLSLKDINLTSSLPDGWSYAIKYSRRGVSDYNTREEYYLDKVIPLNIVNYELGDNVTLSNGIDNVDYLAAGAFYNNEVITADDYNKVKGLIGAGEFSKDYADNLGVDINEYNGIDVGDLVIVRGNMNKTIYQRGDVRDI
ncbi:MAG: hypothetical protein LBM38_03985 [Clostridiales bacterium]|jgi:hypothetical protein|nr:hypothetical protein [Clostridiales bacterium]